MDEQPRKAGDYTVILSFQIGNKEVIVGENAGAAEGERYLCAFCETSEFAALYSDCLVSDDYAETIQCYGQRIAEQAEKTREELAVERIESVVLTAEDCCVITHDDDINGKLIVIKPEVLRHEYRKITHQLKLCRGGFGASPHSRGTAVFCTDLFSGEESRFERWDVLGTVEPEQLPDWAKATLDRLTQQEKKPKNKEMER